MESRSRLAPHGVRAGSVGGPFGLRSGSVRGPFGVRSESVRGPFGIRSGPETKNANVLLQPIFREKPLLILTIGT